MAKSFSNELNCCSKHIDKEDVINILIISEKK